ncbi:MAG: phosphoribosylglycinamide formyltransferase [Anaerolineae bacterium]|nr:phosphoribosylglycinamide formyltransferase [Anaerolineae bacterium]
MKKLAVFISGSGSNLQAILDATADGQLEADVVLVVSNRQSAYGLTRAEKAGVPTLYFPFKPYREAGKNRATYDADLAKQVSQYQPDLIVLAGWMHIFSPAFLNRFPNRVINLHPALPDTFVGVGGIEWAFEAYHKGEIEHGGCMVHYVSPEVDRGPVIVQTIVPILPEDTLNTYAERVHATEHRIIIKAIQKVWVTLGESS